MTPSQKRKLAVIDRETDALAARLKWARAAQRAGKHGIGDLVPPPGGWPSATLDAAAPRHRAGFDSAGAACCVPRACIAIGRVQPEQPARRVSPVGAETCRDNAGERLRYRYGRANR
jgi:hypothetical protein